jgi:tRNA1Val (adenine37-N6)-methyltransferase
MPNTYFRFRQFIVHQQHTAMKVSTDACLFGALVARDLHTLIEADQKGKRALDIGSGTALLTLMIAQQHDFYFDTIEIDPDAYEQGRSNVEGSPWSKKIRCHQGNLNDFAPAAAYQVLICNPPFFAQQLPSPDAQRNRARHDEELTLVQLLDFARKYLSEEGVLFLLMPAARETQVVREAERRGFSLGRKYDISHSSAHPVTRHVWAWSKKRRIVEQARLFMRDANNRPSPEFSALLDPYYLPSGD